MAAVNARSQPSTRSMSKHGGGLGPISRAVTRPEAERATARSRQARAARRARREPPRGVGRRSTRRRVTGADAAPRLWRARIGHLDFFSLCTEHSTSSSLSPSSARRLSRVAEPRARRPRAASMRARRRRPPTRRHPLPATPSKRPSPPASRSPVPPTPPRARPRRTSRGTRTPIRATARNARRTSSATSSRFVACARLVRPCRRASRA